MVRLGKDNRGWNLKRTVAQTILAAGKMESDIE